MHSAMVPDVHLMALSSEYHAKTLDAMWRHQDNHASFYEPPVKQVTPCCLWSSAESGGALAQTSLLPGQTSLVQGQMGLLAGQTSLLTGKTRLMSGQTSMQPGQILMVPGQTGFHSGQTSLHPEQMRLHPGQTSLHPGQPHHVPPTPVYPGRAVQVSVSPAQAATAAPLRSSRVSSSSDFGQSRDISQPLFVDTTVEYDLPKEAYPPEHSEPLLIVHPQYFEHLRHRRTLGAACSCQLCNFYGRRIPHGGHDAAAAAAAAAAAVNVTAVSAAAAPAPTPAPAPAPAAVAEPFQKPEVPLWPARHQAHQPRYPQHQLVPAAVAAPRYNCMLERFGADAACGRLPFVTPSVSCDSDSGYSSVELEQPEWVCSSSGGQCQRRLRHADSDARDVLAKRKRRYEEAAALQAASKRQRLAVWHNGAAAIGMTSFLHHQPSAVT